ncbi:MAG TPA: hypothetical protein PKU97_02045, partial [Kofleriaceae bacterium]|nr:hypothetical protein [Kofleriaceae bacterium]
MSSRWIVTFLLAAAGLVGGCKSRLEAVVDGVLLPECDSPLEPPAAPVVKVLAEPSVADEELALPAGQVQLAIERSVPWARVETLLAVLESRKIEPILLVGQTYRVRRFIINDQLNPRAKRFTITGDAKGKFCVQTAELPQAYCVQGSDRKHIHRAFVRETVREVVKKWEMRQVEIFVDPAIHWADVVRLVDGARTCCGKTKVLVALSPEAPLGPDAEAGNPVIRAQEEAAIRLEESEAASDETGDATGDETGDETGKATGKEASDATGDATEKAASPSTGATPP